MRVATTAQRGASAGLGAAETCSGIPGVLRVVSLGGFAEDLAAIGRDVGASISDQDGTPQVDITFVDALTPSELRILDGGSTAYGDGYLYVLDPSTRTPLARVVQGELWGQAQIVCRRGLKRVPLLSAAVDLAALSCGRVPIHGSAWVTPDGTGVLATGWAHSGKTGALLASCSGGASPVGDDRVLLSSDGSSMMGTGRSVGVRAWHMAQLDLPSLGAQGVRRTLARVAPALDSLSGGVPGVSSRLRARVMERIRRALDMELPLDGLYQPTADARPGVLFVLETHGHPRIVAEALDRSGAARRVAAQSEAELCPTLRSQLAFDYALPEGGWREVGRAPELARNLIQEATANIPAFLLRHPYPCSLQELVSVMNGIVSEL